LQTKYKFAIEHHRFAASHTHTHPHNRSTNWNLLWTDLSIAANYRFAS